MNESRPPLSLPETVSAAVRHIGCTTRCSRDVFLWLQRKQCDRDTADRAICILKTEGYLDDALYARLKVRDCMNLKPVSVMRLRRILREKGIDGAVIEDVLSESDIDDETTAGIILKDRFGDAGPDGDDIRRVVSLLRYRGFPMETIRYILKKKGADGCADGQESY